MNAQEMAELRITLAKADEYCKLLDELKTVDEKPYLSVRATVSGSCVLADNLAKQIFEAGIKAVQKATESKLEHLQINRPKDNEPAKPEKVGGKPVYVDVIIGADRPITSYLSKKIFEAGVAAVKAETESKLEHLQINRPKDNEPAKPDESFTGIIPKGREIL